jgi:hypothetical protein
LERNWLWSHLTSHTSTGCANGTLHTANNTFHESFNDLGASPTRRGSAALWAVKLAHVTRETPSFCSEQLHQDCSTVKFVVCLFVCLFLSPSFGPPSIPSHAPHALKLPFAAPCDYSSSSASLALDAHCVAELPALPQLSG